MFSNNDHTAFRQVRQPVLARSIGKGEGFATGVMIGMFAICLLEGLFRLSLENSLQERSALWTRLTPFALFPSELVLIPVAFYSLARRITWARRESLLDTSDFVLLSLFFVIGIGAAAWGWMRDATHNSWMVDFRQLFLLPLSFVVFVPLAHGCRASVFLRWVSLLCVLIAPLNGVLGLFSFVGVNFSFLPSGTHYSCGHILIAGYCVECLRAMIVRRVQPLFVFLLVFGIVAPLEKPVLASFAVANLLVVGAGIAIGVKSGAFVRTVALVSVLMSFAVGIVYVGYGEEGISYLERRFLKVNVEYGDRDLSSGRFEMWLWGLGVFSESPIFGDGLGGRPLGVGRENRYAATIHNMTIEYLYMSGLVSLMVIGGLLFSLFSHFKRAVFSGIDSHGLVLCVSASVFLLVMICASQVGRALGVANMSVATWLFVALAYRLSRLGRVRMSV